MKEAIRESFPETTAICQGLARESSSRKASTNSGGENLPEYGDSNLWEARVGSLTRKWASWGQGHQPRSRRALQALAGTWISTLRMVGFEPRGASLTTFNTIPLGTGLRREQSHM